MTMDRVLGGGGLPKVVRRRENGTDSKGGRTAVSERERGEGGGQRGRERSRALQPASANGRRAGGGGGPTPRRPGQWRILDSGRAWLEFQAFH